MSQPILLICSNISAEELKVIQPFSTKYQIETSQSLNLENDLDLVEIILGWQADLGTKILNSPTSKLKWIQAYSAGIDYFDLEILQTKNILLSNASGVHSLPITESVLGMLLSFYRGIFTSTIDQQAKVWNKHNHLTELGNQKALIVGTGKIGRQLAKVLASLGVQVYGINRSGYSLEHFTENYSQSEINQVLPEMDIVINILPLTKETHHFYNEERFQKMKTGVVFINVGRGPSVDSAALYQACATKQITFAGIDVFEEEPLPSHSPLWELDNLLITPHISGNTLKYNQRLLAIFANNLKSYTENGELSQNIVSLEAGY